jgi:hypothetical protein
MPIGVRDDAVAVPEDLFYLPGDFPGFVRQPQRGVDDGMIGAYHGIGTGCRFLVGVEVEGA